MSWEWELGNHLPDSANVLMRARHRPDAHLARYRGESRPLAFWPAHSCHNGLATHRIVEIFRSGASRKGDRPPKERNQLSFENTERRRCAETRGILPVPTSVMEQIRMSNSLNYEMVSVVVPATGLRLASQ